MARAAALGALLLALAALSCVLVMAADRLDRRYEESRFVVRYERCPLEVIPRRFGPAFEITEICPPWIGDDGT